MKIFVTFATGLFTIYAVISAMGLAQAGAQNQIPQLEAAGGAELVIPFLCVVAGLLMFWRWGAAAISFGLAALWSMVVALVYLDVTLWLWLAFLACLACVCGWKVYQRRYTRIQTLKSPV